VQHLAQDYPEVVDQDETKQQQVRYS